MTVCYGSDLLISMHALQTGEGYCRASHLFERSNTDRTNHRGVHRPLPSPLCRRHPAPRYRQSRSALSIYPTRPITDERDLLLAKMLNHTGKIGTIAPGAFADLLVLSRNPLEDITVLDRPEQYLDAVVKDGRLMVGQLEGFPR